MLEGCSTYVKSSTIQMTFTTMAWLTRSSSIPTVTIVAGTPTNMSENALPPTNVSPGSLPSA